MEQLLVDLLTDDPVGRILIERKQNIELEMIERTIQAGEGRIDFLWMGGKSPEDYLVALQIRWK